MEEYIKILKKFINEVNKIKDTPNRWYGYSNDEMHILKRAIENLIKRNKELEERHKLIVDNYTTDCSEYEELINKDYISKSKVKEKIEELKYQTLYINGITDKKDTEIASVGSLMGKIQALQELLEK